MSWNAARVAIAQPNVRCSQGNQSRRVQVTTWHLCWWTVFRFPKTSCSSQVNMVTFGQQADLRTLYNILHRILQRQHTSLNREDEKQLQRCYIDVATAIIPLREASPGSVSLQREATRTTRSCPPLNRQLACWEGRKLCFQQDPWSLGRGQWRAAQCLELFSTSSDEAQEERGAEGATGRQKLAYDY